MGHKQDRGGFVRPHLQHLLGKCRNLNCFSIFLFLAVAPRQEGEDVPQASGHPSLPPPAYLSWVSFKVFSVSFTEWGEITVCLFQPVHPPVAGEEQHLPQWKVCLIN